MADSPRSGSKRSRRANVLIVDDVPRASSPKRSSPKKKTPAKRSPTKKTPVKKTPTKRTPAKKTVTKRSSPKLTPSPKRGSPSLSRRPPPRRSPTLSKKRSPSPKRVSIAKTPEIERTIKTIESNEKIVKAFQAEHRALDDNLDNLMMIRGTSGLSPREYEDIDYQIQKTKADLNSLNSRMDEALERESEATSHLRDLTSSPRLTSRSRSISPRSRSTSPRMVSPYAERAYSLREGMRSPSKMSPSRIIAEQDKELAQALEADKASGAMGGVMASLGGAFAALLSSPRSSAKLEEEVAGPLLTTPAKEASMITRRTPIATRRSASPPRKATSPRRSPSPLRRSPASPSLSIARPTSPVQAGKFEAMGLFPMGVLNNGTRGRLFFPTDYTIGKLNRTISAKYNTDLVATTGPMKMADSGMLVSDVFQSRSVIKFVYPSAAIV